MQLRFSLIITTIHGRTSSLEACLASIEYQGFRSFEAIIVDQSSSAETQQLVQRHEWARYIQAPPDGLSASRNIGVGLARGELLIFPDDDATLAPNMLESVDRIFLEYPHLGLLSGSVVDPNTLRRIFRFPAIPAALTIWNVMLRHCSASLVIRRAALASQTEIFDPLLGVGAQTPFGSGEETDLVLRLLLTGVPGRYEPSVVIYHVNTTISQVALPKVISYGRGLGACFRKCRERFGWWPVGALWSWLMVRAVVGVLVDTLRGRFLQARRRVASIGARIDGWYQYGKLSGLNYRQEVGR